MTSSISTAEAVAPDAPVRNDPPIAPPAAADGGTPAWLPIALWVAFVAIALIANLGSLRGEGFLWTDQALVQQNTMLNSLSGVQRIWAGIFDPSSVRLSQYSPLSQATFFIDRLIWGEHIGGYRLTSCLMHATTALLVWYLLRRLAMPAALAVALLFLAHPMTVESVSLLTERRTILATFFALSGTFILLRGMGVIAPIPGSKSALPDEPMRLYAMASALFVIGFFAHPAIACVPVVVLLIAWWRRRPIDLAAIGVCVALAIAGVALLDLDSRVERNRSGTPAEQWKRSATFEDGKWRSGGTTAGDLAIRTQIAGRAVGFYAAKLALPFPLMSDYPRWRTPNDVAVRGQFLTEDDLKERRVILEPDIAPGSIVDWIAPVLIVGALVALFAFSGRIGRGPFVAAASFTLCLLPLLGFVDVGWMRNSFVADRAAYLASVPFFAGILALIGPALLAPAQRTTAIWTMVVVTVVYLALSSSVSKRYTNAVTFWQSAASDRRGNPRSAEAQMGFADAVLNVAPPHDPDPKNAARALENARFQRPGDPLVHLKIGNLYAALGNFDAALSKYAFVIKHFPLDVRGPLNAGDLMRRQADRKQTDPALRFYTLNYYRTAAELDPRNAYAQMMVGITAYDVVARLPNGDPQIPDLLEETASAFNEAVQADPYNADNLILMSRTLIAMGRLSDASGLLRTATLFAPKRADAYELIGEAAIMGNDVRGAEAAIRMSVFLDEKNPATLLKLGSLLQGTSRFEEAKAVLQKILEIEPDHAEAKLRLAECEAEKAESAATPTTRPTTAPAAPTTRP